MKNFLLLYSIIFICVATLVGCGMVHQGAIIQARDLITSRQYGAALEKLSFGEIYVDPTSDSKVEIVYLRATCYEGLERYSDATGALRYLIDKLPDTSYAYQAKDKLRKIEKQMDELIVEGKSTAGYKVLSLQTEIDKDLHWEDEMISVVLEKIEKRHDWPTEIFSALRYKLPKNHVFIVFHLSVSFKKQCKGNVSPGAILFDNKGHKCRLKFELSNRISDTKWSVKTIHQIHIQAEPAYMVLKYTWISEKNGDKKNGELQLNLLKKNSSS